MHIAIEGIDGVGKSTVGELLAEKLHFRFIEKPLHYLLDSEKQFENYLRIRDYVNASGDKVLAAWFYGLGNMFLYHKFKGENVVTDRHLVSNYFWSGEQKSQPIFDCLIKLIGAPDYTFLLYASEQTVLERLRKRDPTDPDLRKTHMIPEGYKKMEKFLLENKMKYKRIDTTALAPQQIVEIIISTLFEDPRIAKNLTGLGITQ